MPQKQLQLFSQQSLCINESNQWYVLRTLSFLARLDQVKVEDLQNLKVDKEQEILDNAEVVL